MLTNIESANKDSTKVVKPIETTTLVAETTDDWDYAEPDVDDGKYSLKKTSPIIISALF